MSKLRSDSQLARRAENGSLLRAATESKQVRNNEAAEREHFRLTRKVAHEFDNAFGSGGFLKRGLARANANGFSVPAQRKRALISSTSGRSFHGHGTTHRKEMAVTGAKARRRSGSTGAAHYRYIEDPGPGEIAAALLSASHAAYIDGPRVEMSDEGERQSRTNIDGSFDDRVRFFALANDFERQSHGDKISLDLNRTSDELAAVLADPLCDPALQEAFEQRRLPYIDKPVVVQLKGSTRDLRALMKTHGIDLSTERTNEDRRAHDGIAFHTGRSGRTHFRWVFELPVEFTARQRKHVLDDLGAHMQSLGCMYAAVIHAPDPHNDEKNYHIHLIFYDRICRRLDGTEDDLCNVRGALKGTIRDEIARGEIQSREWDFTIARRYKCGRSYKTHFPFRAEKSRGVTQGKDFKKRFRREYAAIVNGVSKRAGGQAIYDPRSYTDRNVDITPGKKLGPRFHASETAGIPTIIGMSNERHQANDERRSIMRHYEAEASRTGALARSLAPYVASHHPRVAGWARQPAQDVAELQSAVDAKLRLDLWALESARERSRAVLVRDRQGRAAEKGPARERRVRQALADAAQARLDELDSQDVQMLPIIAELQRDLKQIRDVTNESVDRTIANCRYIQRVIPVGEGAAQADSPSGAAAGEHDQVPLPETAPATSWRLPRDHLTLGDARPRAPIDHPRTTDGAEVKSSPASRSDSLPAGRLPTGSQHILEATERSAGLMRVDAPSPAMHGGEDDDKAPMRDNARNGDPSAGEPSNGATPPFHWEDVESSECRPVAVPSLHDIKPIAANRPMEISAPVKEIADGITHDQECDSPKVIADIPPTLTDFAKAGANDLRINGSGRRNIMQRKTADARRAETGGSNNEQTTNTTGQPLIHGAARIPLTWGPLESPDLTAGARHSPFSATSEAIVHSPSIDPDIEPPADKEQASEPILPGLPPLNHVSIGMKADKAPAEKDLSDESAGVEDRPSEAAPNSISVSAEPPPVDSEVLTSTATDRVPEQPALSAGSRSASPASPLPTKAMPIERPAMSVEKENIPSTQLSLGQVKQRQADHAPATLGSPRTSAESGVTGDTIEPDASNPSGDVSAIIVEKMLAAFVARLEKRNVRLAERDGQILAAPGQDLERGDLALIKAAQAACRTLKERQDGVVVNVAKALRMHAVAMAAGNMPEIDPIVLLLSKKWAGDPTIAATQKHIELQSRLTADTQKKVASLAEDKSTSRGSDGGVPPGGTGGGIA